MNEHRPTRQNLKDKQSFDKWETLFHLADILDECVERYMSYRQHAEELRKKDMYSAWTCVRIMQHFDVEVADRAADYLQEKNV